jgi:2-dehydro-3-deoxyphosphogluconate aldolase/(4S)-4-hydroxy-2-oxoglutarate aldolase
MSAADVVKQIEAGGIIALIRLTSVEDLLPAAEALQEGGLTAIEFTSTVPGALPALERARTRLGRTILLGVGIVLTKDQARDAIRAGADFIGAPTVNPEVLRAGVDAGIPVVPGAFTPTEIVHTWGLGASLVKVFPASAVGPGYIKELRGPLSHVPLVPTGGVSLQNVAPFIQAGAAAVGVGGDLVSQQALGRRAFREVAQRAKEFIDAVQMARERGRRPVPPIMPIEGPDTR